MKTAPIAEMTGKYMHEVAASLRAQANKQVKVVERMEKAKDGITHRMEFKDSKLKQRFIIKFNVGKNDRITGIENSAFEVYG